MRVNWPWGVRWYPTLSQKARKDGARATRHPHCGSELKGGAPALGNFDGNFGNDILHQAKVVALDFKAMELELE